MSLKDFNFGRIYRNKKLGGAQLSTNEMWTANSWENFPGTSYFVYIAIHHDTEKVSLFMYDYIRKRVFQIWRLGILRNIRLFIYSILVFTIYLK